MGSATPSIESSFNLMKNKFAGVQLNERYGNIDPPEIEIIDLKLSYKKKEMNGAFSYLNRMELKLHCLMINKSFYFKTSVVMLL